MRKMQQQNPMVDMVRHQLDASMQLANALFSGTEKIDRAVLDATHQAMGSQLKFVHAVTDIRDPSKMAELQNVLSHRPEQSMQCQQQIMLAFAEMQAEFGKSIQFYMERLNQTASSRISETEQIAAAANTHGHNASFNPVSSMMSMWETAFREATTLANRNMMVARNSLETAANAASEAVAHTVESVHRDDHDEHVHAERKQGASRRK